MHTQGTQVARTLRPSLAHAMRWEPCHGALGAVSWPPLAMSHTHIAMSWRRVAACLAAPCHDTRHRIGTLESLSRVSQRSCVVSWRAAALYCSVVLWLPGHDTKFVSRHTPWPSHARALPLVPLAGRSCCGPLLAVSWPCWPYRWAPGRHVTAPAAHPSPASQALCHDTIPCTVTQHWKIGSNPSSLLHTFFSLIFFFPLCSTYWKTTIF